MDRRPRISFTEWSFVAVLFLLSAVLTALQFSWVGELSRVEADRLKSSLEEQARAVAREFDAELADAGRALKPNREELASGDPVAAVVARVREWQGTKPRPLFRRIAVAVPAGWDAKLTGIEPATGNTSAIEWPEDWTPLRDYVRRMLAGGPPAFHDPRGVLLEFPLMGGRTGRGTGGPESAWLLLEVDLDHLRNRWLPELVAAHLDIRGAETCDVAVEVWATGETVWSRGTLPKDATPLKVRFHREGRAGTSGPRGQSADGVWSLRIAPRSGALESIVGRSRRRNLAIAGVANALIVAAGVALVFHTRRSRELAESRMRFVATVSHELRTPLTVIRAAGHNLLHGIAASPEKVAEYSRLIIQHADQLKELTEQTLVLSAAGRWELRDQGKPVDLRAVLREVVTAAAEEARAAQCQLECRLPESLPAVLGDASALRRAFHNLVSNALKHGSGGRWVGVEIATVQPRGQTHVEVRVSDRGPGIPGVEQARIFEPFFRGQRAMESQIRGTGLGLSVVREIVGAHGGTVELEPSDTGAVFRVCLPVLE